MHFNQNYQNLATIMKIMKIRRRLQEIQLIIFIRKEYCLHVEREIIIIHLMWGVKKKFKKKLKLL
jgi:hypothetical protein